MKKLFLTLILMVVGAVATYSQSYDPRLLWYGSWPNYNYLNYPSSNPPIMWNYETNPPVLWDGLSGQKGKPLQSPSSFYLYYKHNSKFLFNNYAIPTPLMYMGYPDWANPAMPWYFEPHVPPVGNIIGNMGPTLIIEFHISKALSIPIQTPFGKRYVDQTYYPYTRIQTLVPWPRMKFDTVDEILWGVIRRRSTWKFTSPTFTNYNFINWQTNGNFETNISRPLWFVNEEFTTGRSPWLQDGDRFVCQAKVTYLFPYNSNGYNWLWGPYDSVWDITFWSNPIFLTVQDA